jgi:hypothetical protein
MVLMVSRIVVGILKEQHSDHIILTDASRVSLPHGMVLEYFPAGSRVTIFYGHNDAGEMVVKSITPSDTSHLRHLPPAARWDYTKREEMASTGEHQTHRPNPICAVCGKPIPPGAPRYRRGLASVHEECEEGEKRSQPKSKSPGRR